MSVTYVLADAYASSGLSGATAEYRGGQSFDILAALVTGGGNSKGVGGSFAVTDDSLIAALDHHLAVKRQSGGGGTPISLPSTGAAQVAVADSNGNYPSRPSSSLPVIWVGPSAPAGKALDNDVWISSATTVTV